ncbi:unnamed protein product [Calypogeia fissa]
MGQQEEGMMMEERMKAAVIEACRALRRRHKLEEGAHGPAVAALAMVASSRGVELQTKVEGLQQELTQSYRAHAEAREQLVTTLTASQGFHSQLAEKEALIADLQEKLVTLRSRVEELESVSGNQEKALDVAEHERTNLKLQVEELEAKLSKAQTDNKMLLDRIMQQKLQDAERLNEANAMYEDMMERLKATRLDELAKQQVDGIVRQSEAGAELYVDSGIPSRVRHRLQAHEGGGSAISFENNTGVLYSGGSDRLVQKWDTAAGAPLETLRGCLGSVLDLSVSMDNKQVLAACTDHKLYLWDATSGRLKHTLTGHSEKVVGVDMSQGGGRRAVSASHDRTIKIWDLTTGYGVNTIVCFSNCNAVCGTSDGQFICSGHMDGNLRMWDIRSGKLAHELAAHGQSITSVCLSRTGHMVLSSGRDNVHNLFDVRTLDILHTFRSPNYRTATNWTRACLSPNEKLVVGGSADGTVVMWSLKSGENEILLKGGHASPILSCAWSSSGKPLATADKSGRVCVWE